MVFRISSIQRESGDITSIDVDLELASDTFQKLTKKTWISFMVIVNIYLRDKVIEFPSRSKYDCSLILLGTESGGLIGGG